VVSHGIMVWLIIGQSLGLDVARDAGQRPCMSKAPQRHRAH
jgi:hypothetical protein